LQRIKYITKEEYIALALGRYEALEKLKAADNFYDYEKVSLRYGRI
jgi:hypothetical protein